MTLEDAVVAGSWGRSAFRPGDVHEQERLDVLGRLFDAGSREVLDRAGVGPGQRVLEVGGGAGTLVPWLRERIGPGGELVVTDLDIGLAARHAGGNVEVLRHDVTADPRPGEAFDVIHARFVLMHLPGRAAVVERLASWLRPGGVLCVEDSAIVTGVCVDGAYRSALEELVAAMTSALGTDFGWVHGMPVPLGDAGLVDLGVRGETFVARPGNLTTEMLLRSFEQLVREGHLDGAVLDAARTAMARPRFVDHAFAVTAAWGRRP